MRSDWRPPTGESHGKITQVVAACALCGVAVVGCGGSGTPSTQTAAQPATTIDALCRTPCTDGQQDYVDHVKILANTMAGASHTVVSLRLRVKNVSSGSATIDPKLGVELIDSQQQSITPDNLIVAYTDGRSTTPPECPDLTAATLVPGDSHAFRLCFGLAGANDLPRVVRIESSAEIPLQ